MTSTSQWVRVMTDAGRTDQAVMDRAALGWKVLPGQTHDGCVLMQLPPADIQGTP